MHQQGLGALGDSNCSGYGHGRWEEDMVKGPRESSGLGAAKHLGLGSQGPHAQGKMTLEVGATEGLLKFRLHPGTKEVVTQTPSKVDMVPGCG